MWCVLHTHTQKHQSKTEFEIKMTANRRKSEMKISRKTSNESGGKKIFEKMKPYAESVGDMRIGNRAHTNRSAH